jgi:hypothetical protein
MLGSMFATYTEPVKLKRSTLPGRACLSSCMTLASIYWCYYEEEASLKIHSWSSLCFFSMLLPPMEVVFLSTSNGTAGRTSGGPIKTKDSKARTRTRTRTLDVCEWHLRKENLKFPLIRIVACWQRSRLRSSTHGFDAAASPTVNYWVGCHDRDDTVLGLSGSW